MTLLLASKSETRRRMLEAAGVPFAIVNAQLDEDALKAKLTAAGHDAPAIATALAEAKARAATAMGVVLGSDQTLELEDGSMLSKPRSREDAADQLARMSGRAHRLHAAAALVEDGEVVWSACETVTLHMRPLSAAFIRDYLDREYEAVRWSVGCYRFEGVGAQLFERVEGSHFAVLGLPLLPLLACLRGRGLLPS